MAQFDLPLAQLQQYRYPRPAPADLAQFWQRTLAESMDSWRPPTSTPAPGSITAFDIADICFSGFAGDQVRAWSIRPAEVAEDLPAVVEFIGYGGGRGLPHQHLWWAAHGYHTLVVDSRGQGSVYSSGDTADPHGSAPAAPGFLTRGLPDPDQLYYRRLLTDAVLSVAAVRALPGVDPMRVAVYGHSQGGAMALVAAALADRVRVCVARTPFLCGIDRNVVMATDGPYLELATYLAVHRDSAVLAALSYVDLIHLAPSISCPTWLSVGLMDSVCPPSGIYGLVNNLRCPAEVSVWPYNGHEAGGAVEEAQIARWIAPLIG